GVDTFRCEAAILSRMRSPMTSRSNCANDNRTLRVRRPIEVVVLNCCVTETKLRRSVSDTASTDAATGEPRFRATGRARRKAIARQLYNEACSSKATVRDWLAAREFARARLVITTRMHNNRGDFGFEQRDGARGGQIRSLADYRRRGRFIEAIQQNRFAVWIL